MDHKKATVLCWVRFAVVLTALPLFFAARLHAQVAFIPSINISKSTGTATDQQFALGPNGNVYIVWLDNSSGSYQALFSRSTDGGTTFSTPQIISSAGASSNFPPQIAVDPSGNVVLAWTGVGTNAPIYFSRSTNAGVTFSSPTPDTPAYSSALPSGTNSGPAQFALDPKGNIDVVWSNNANASAGFQVYFNQSTDGGSTFSTPVNVSNDANTAFMPQIAVDSLGPVDVAWLDQPAGQSNYDNLLFSTSANSGATFAASTQVEAGNPGSTTFGASQLLIGANHNIYLSWTQVINAQNLSYFSRSTGGVAFSAPQEIAAISDSRPNPVMAVDPTGEIVAIVWQTGQSASTVNLTSSGDGGTTFSASETVAPPYSTVPQIAVDSAGHFDIVYEAAQYQQYTNFGLTFTQSVNHTSFSPVQDIALGVGGTVSVDSSGNIYIAWQQNSNNQTSIYFTHSIGTGLSSLSLNAATVMGGNSTTGGVTLSAPAPTGGAVVSLSSSNGGGATVPLTVTVPAGSTSEMFNIATSAVTTSTSVVITASLGSTTQSATLTVAPASSGSTGGSGSGSPSFSVAAKSTALTITAPGQSVSTTLTFTSTNGLTGSGSLSSPTCGISASEKISCALSAFTLPANGTATATLTFASTASSGAGVTVRQLLLLFLLPFALVPFAMRKLRIGAGWAMPMSGGCLTRLRPVVLAFAVALIACGAFIGCGSTSKGTSSTTTTTTTAGTSGTPTGAVQGVNASITINGVTQTVPNLSLTVQ